MEIIKILFLSILLFSCSTQDRIEGLWHINDDSYFVITSEQITLFSTDKTEEKLFETELSYSIKIESDKLICTNPDSYGKSFEIINGKVDRSSYSGGKMVNLDKIRIFTFTRRGNELFLISPKGEKIIGKLKDM